jgi:hypothetical protein
MERKTRERPKWQLDDVVIEFDSRVMEIVQAVDDQDGDERSRCADQRPRQRENRGESDHDRDLRRGVIGDIGAKEPVHGFDQPPRQGRQLVITKLPFAAVDKRFDQIERQIRVNERR